MHQGLITSTGFFKPAKWMAFSNKIIIIIFTMPDKKLRGLLLDIQANGIFFLLYL